MSAPAPENSASDPLALLDATAQAELVSAGEATPLELVEAAITRIEKLNPTLNAVIWQDNESARQKAQAVGSGNPRSGSLAGVPFLIKDIGATQAGLPYWLGNAALKAAGNMSLGDTELGARFRRAGLVTIGKTNLPELGSTPTTQPASCGPTKNPWDTDRSPAGSSGGSAAAVAAGLVPIAHANDGGGSTRLPAAWCGLVGLKTTRGRVPNPLNVSRLTSELAVTRTVRDTALILDAVQGAAAADLYDLPRPTRPYVDELAETTGSLRIGVLSDGGMRTIDPACVEGVAATAAVLESAGHHVTALESATLLGPASRVNGEMWMAGLARRVDMLGEYLGRPLTVAEVEPYNWTAAQRGRAMTAAEWASAAERQQAWVVDVLQWFDQVDVLLTPTSGCPPMLTTELEPPPDKPWKIGQTHALIGLFTLPFNVTGQPAISLPVWQTQNGLPVGMQLVAKMGREDLLVRLAAFLEKAMPWQDRRPMVHA